MKSMLNRHKESGKIYIVADLATCKDRDLSIVLYRDFDGDELYARLLSEYG